MANPDPLHVDGCELGQNGSSGIREGKKRLTIWAKLRKRLLSIEEAKGLAVARGFPVQNETTTKHLELILRKFLAGYNAAISCTSLDQLGPQLDACETSHRGFAYEGAAMGLAIAGFFTPFSSNWKNFVTGIGAKHIYMVYAGYGWALARLPVAIMPAMNRLKEPFRWLVIDGYGFHQGYFHWQKYVRDARPPAGITGYAARAFDQGLGRCLWFVCGTEPDAIAKTISGFEPSRVPDLWAGVGTAAGYAGGATAASLSQLKAQAGPHVFDLALGAVLAAEARLRGENPAGHTELACQQLCGVSMNEAAQIFKDCYPDDTAADDGGEPYELVRARIRKWFQEAKGAEKL